MQPRFSEIEYRVHPFARNYGLRSKTTGAGWLNLGTESDLKFEQRGDFPSFIELVTTPELAFRGNAAYLISQLLTPIGYYKDGFDWERCLDYQLRYIDHMGQSNRDALNLVDEYEKQLAAKQAEEKHKWYLRQFPEKRALRLARQAEQRRIKPVGWYDEKYPPPCKDPAPKFAPAPPPEPIQRPTPTLSENDQRALEILDGHQRYMASFCEDHDK